MTTRPSAIAAQGARRDPRRGRPGTPTMTCRVDCGASAGGGAGHGDHHDVGEHRHRLDLAPATAETLGATQTSTTEPWRTVAGRSSETTLTGTSTRSAPESSANAERGSSSPAETSRFRVAPSGRSSSAREVAVGRRVVREPDLATLEVASSTRRARGQVRGHGPDRRPCRRPPRAAGRRATTDPATSTIPSSSRGLRHPGRRLRVARGTAAPVRSGSGQRHRGTSFSAGRPCKSHSVSNCSQPDANGGRVAGVNATPRFLQLADVAEVLNISGAQVYALVRRGELRAIKIGGRGQWRVEASELEAYIERAYADADEFVRRPPLRRGAATPRTDPPPGRLIRDAPGTRSPGPPGPPGRWRPAPSPTCSSKKSRPTRPTRPSTCWPSTKRTRQCSCPPRKPAEHGAQGQPVHHRPGLLVVGPVGESPLTRGDAVVAHDPLRRTVDQQQPVLAEPCQPAAHDMAADEPDPQVATQRGVQPRGEVDPGVLGQGQVGDVGVPVGEVQALGLLLEVVEQGEHRCFPAHATSHAPAPGVANGLWTSD